MFSIGVRRSFGCLCCNHRYRVVGMGVVAGLLAVAVSGCGQNQDSGDSSKTDSGSDREFQSDSEQPARPGNTLFPRFTGKNQLMHVSGTCISKPSLAQVHDRCTLLTELSPVMVRVGSINKPVLTVRTVMIGEVQEPLIVTPSTYGDVGKL